MFFVDCQIAATMSVTDSERKVILGTSNVKRNYDPKSWVDLYAVKKCCRMETFKAEAAMLSTNNEYIIISDSIFFT